MKYTNLKDIIEKLNIYETIKFEYFNKDGDNYSLTTKNHNNLIELLYTKKDRVIVKCVECNEDLVFFFNYKIYHYGSENSEKIDIDTLSISIEHATRWIYLNDNIDSNYLDVHFLYPTFYIEYDLWCSNNPGHIQKLLLKITTDENFLIIRKIGQDPLNTMLQENNTTKYEKQLKMFNSLEDFKNLSACTSRSLYAGASTYLRRILEKMVDYYIKENGITPNSNYIEDKISSISKFLDKDFKDIAKKTYGMLSKAIHQLNEDEIKKFYFHLYQAILFQLQHQKQIDDSIEEKKKIKNIITNYDS